MAEEGHAEAQYLLGYMYSEGIYVKQNWEIAREWFEKSADQGYAESQYQLGYMHSNDGDDGVSRAFYQAVPLIELAALQDHPEAQHMMGLFYQRGIEVYQDDKMAFYYFKQAASFRSG